MKIIFVKKIVWGVLLSAVLIFIPLHTYAQSAETAPLGDKATGFSCDKDTGENCKYTPLEPLTKVDQSGNTDLGSFLISLFKILFSLSGLLAVGMLVWGGIEYMVSEVPGVKLHALDRAKAAVFGILILAGSWLLLNTINPCLLVFDLNVGTSRGANCEIIVNNGQTSGESNNTTTTNNFGGGSYTTSSAASAEAQGYGSNLVDTKNYGAIMYSNMADLKTPSFLERNRNFGVECYLAGGDAKLVEVAGDKLANICEEKSPS